MKLYLDASVLVALLTADIFSGRADELIQWASGPFLVSDWAEAEFAAAVARRFRTGQVSETVAHAAFFGFDKWAALSADRVETTSQDLALCSIFVRRLELGLRSPDALHIAIAKHHQCSLASFDVRMTEAARKLGVDVWSSAPD